MSADKPARNPPSRRALKPRTAVQDHDLPILAVQERSHAELDWEALLHSGVQPALALGAERRSQGKR